MTKDPNLIAHAILKQVTAATPKPPKPRKKTKKPRRKT